MGGNGLPKLCSGKSTPIHKAKRQAGLYVVDCVRIEGQVNAIRRAYGPEVFHIHVKADPKVLKQRYLDAARVRTMLA